MITIVMCAGIWMLTVEALGNVHNELYMYHQ